jgi:flagellar biosynthesis protein FliQ
MDSADIGSLLRETFMVTASIGGPLLLIGLIVGIIVSVLQAITQIHEATLAFIPKAIAVSVTLLLMTPFITSTLIAFAQRLFDRIISIGIS